VISITALGEVDRTAIRGRSGAQVGDDLWVSGELGDASAVVAYRKGLLRLPEADVASMARRLDWPEPRVALGLELRSIATAAIDVSDGLLADVRHLARRSSVGVQIVGPSLPRSDSVRRLDRQTQRRCVFAGGDDYELLFSAPPAARSAVEAAAERCCTAVKLIGSITCGESVEVVGEPDFDATLAGYDHFPGALDP
jgi:thiamine-monophosphate kinase